MSMKELNEASLRERALNFARSERKITAQLLEHIAEIKKRSLFLKWGFRSLFDYVTQELGYSEAAAWRRIQGAKLFDEVPEIQVKIESGELNLSQIAQMQKDLKREEEATGEKVTREQKRELLFELCNKTTRETQIILDQKLTTGADPKPYVEERHRKNESVDFHLNMPKELYEELQRVKDLYSHIAPGADLIKILQLMVKDVRKMRDPLIKKRSEIKTEKANQESASQEKTITQERQNRTSQPGVAANGGASLSESREQHEAPENQLEITEKKSETSEKKLETPENKPESSEKKPENPTQCLAAQIKRHVTNPRKVSASVRRLVMRSTGGKCDICESSFQVETDHIQPIYAGGGNEITNLRPLCRLHNQQRYRESSGIKTLTPPISSLIPDKPTQP